MASINPLANILQQIQTQVIAATSNKCNLFFSDESRSPIQHIITFDSASEAQPELADGTANVIESRLFLTITTLVNEPIQSVALEGMEQHLIAMDALNGWTPTQPGTIGLFITDMIGAPPSLKIYGEGVAGAFIGAFNIKYIGNIN